MGYRIFAGCKAGVLILILTLPLSVFADALDVVVTSPFIDVHTGPASEYPIFHVVSQGERIEILSSRTAWYKIRFQVSGSRASEQRVTESTSSTHGLLESSPGTDRTREGWIKQESLMATALPDGSRLTASSGTFEDYQIRDWELTIAGGVLDNISAMTVVGSWVWTRNLSVDASYTQALGDFSDNKIWSLRMRHTIFPGWKISPYLALGTGEIRTQPRANLVQSGDEIRESSHYEVAAGVRYYFTRSMLLRAEYRSLLALTDRDEQERLDQWMLGVSVFF